MHKNTLKKEFENYRNATADRFYQYSNMVFMLMAYEILLGISYNPRVAAYNGVDLWFKASEFFIPKGTLIISLAIIFHRVAFIFMDWFGIKDGAERKKDREARKEAESKNKAFEAKPKDKYRPNWYYVLGIVLEGFTYGTVLYIFLPILAWLVMLVLLQDINVPPPLDANMSLRPYHTSFVQDLALAFGAGFYDEYIFRYWLIIGLTMLTTNASFKSICSKYLKIEVKPFSKWGLIIVSALIFSLSHYLFAFGDNLNLYSFIYRFFFGIAMYFVFNRARLQVAAWAHFFYDTWYFLLV